MKRGTRRIGDHVDLESQRTCSCPCRSTCFRPTDVDRVRLLGALRSRLGDAALPADMGTAATSASRAIWPLISTVVVGVGIVGGALFFAARHGRDSNPPRAEVAPVAATMEAIEPIAVPSAEKPVIATATPPATDPPTPPAASAHRRQDRLAAEVELLSRATRDLHAGHPTEALAALDEYRQKFPKGLLYQEQRAARAQALCALGRFDEANAKLADLASQSPLAVRAKATLRGESGGALRQEPRSRPTRKLNLHDGNG